MTTATQNLQRAARAFKLALTITDDTARISAEFPVAGKKLQEAAKALAAEGRKAEAESKES